MSENQKPEKTIKKIIGFFKRVVVAPVGVFLVLLLMIFWIGFGKRLVEANRFYKRVDDFGDKLFTWAED